MKYWKNQFDEIIDIENIKEVTAYNLWTKYYRGEKTWR